MSPAAFRIKTKLATEKRNPDKDWQLVQRCQAGERAAQFELYQLYKDWVFNIAYRMANHRQEAEDITQQVFIRLFRKIKTFRGDSAFSSWFYRLAMNICINHFRKEKKRKQRFSDDLSDLENTKLMAAKSKIERPDLKPQLEKAMRTLPEGYRSVFILYDVEGYNHQEIGEMLDIAEGTSKSQLHKARKELRQHLEPYLLLQNL